MKDDKLIEWIFKITVSTLAMVVLAVVLVLMFGLFDDKVDNDKIFDIVGPAFSTVIGAFVGLLGGLSLNRNSNKNNCSNKDSK